MEGPPTRMMYSPDAGDAAFAPNAKTDKKQMSKRRFIMNGESTIYAGREIAQVVGRDRRARRRTPHHVCGRPGGPSLPIFNYFLRAPDLPKFVVSGSMRSCHREPALQGAKAANYNSTPSQIRRRQRS